MTRTVAWGDALAIEMFKTPGGLKRVVDAIAEVMGGSHYGTRNTYAKLYKAQTADELNAKDRWRAWLLLSALGHDPETWGLPANMAPPYMNGYQLVQSLQDAVRRQDDGGGPEDPFSIRWSSHPRLNGASVPLASAA